MKKIIIVLILIIFAGTLYWFFYRSNTGAELNAQGKMQVCPEIWQEAGSALILDGSDVPAPEAYFIYNGEKRSVEEFDTDWIRQNCQDKTKRQIGV